MSTTARVKNWAEFQHYRDRAPPWIKLHRKLLDDFEFARLPIASKALAPLLWLLAAESIDGTVRIDPDWLAFRLHMPQADVEAGLSPLIDRGFLEIASGELAPCLQRATPETETETEGKKSRARQAARSVDRFAEFWNLYPVKKGKKHAEASWRRQGLDAIADRIIADVVARKAEDRQWREGFIPHGSTYVNGAGWEDAIDRTATKAPTGRDGRPEPVQNPGGTSPVVEDTPQRRLDAMTALLVQRMELGQITKDQARAEIAPYREAVRRANADS